MSLKSIVLLSLVEVIGDFGLKGFARTGATSSLVQGSLGYLGVAYLLVQALKSGNLLYVNGMWDGTSALLGSVAAYLFLGERLHGPMQYAGLVVVIAGIFMLHAPKGKIPF
jgi:multidrug transporter EmrE-like cation transporter